MQSAAFRKREGRCLLAGKNCIEEVSYARLIVTKRSLIPKNNTCEVYLVTDALMKKISGLVNPEGILAEVAIPEERPLTGTKIVVADRVQDPGNLGTLIRSSLAFGWDGMFLLTGSVDPYNDKALRAAKGATFHLPLQSGSWQDLKKIIEENRLQLVVADTKGKAPDAFSNMPIGLVLGNEAKGPDVPLPHETVTLAMNGQMESLNVSVAGSILLYLYQGSISL